MARNDQVEALLATPSWNGERRALRRILLGCGLSETVKWGKLCYTHGGANVAIFLGLKDHCRLNLFKGALLADPEGLLRAQGRDTQAVRTLPFTSLEEIAAREDAVRDLIQSAIAVEDRGLRPEMPARDDLVLPQELAQALAADANLACAFARLTPGRRRSHALHVDGARQARTRSARAEAAAAKIREGKGWNER